MKSPEETDRRPEELPASDPVLDEGYVLAEQTQKASDLEAEQPTEAEIEQESGQTLSNVGVERVPDPDPPGEGIGPALLEGTALGESGVTQDAAQAKSADLDSDQFEADLDAYEANSQAIEAEVEGSVPEAAPDQELDMDMDR